MRPKKPDADLAELSHATALVLSELDAQDLCSYRTGPYRTWWGGAYYHAERRYPYPPLSAHSPHPPSRYGDCADCDDFSRWRRAYVEWAHDAGRLVMPEMVAPLALDDSALTGLNPHDATASEWLKLVSLMIAAARPVESGN